MTDSFWAALREPFDPKQIGKKPGSRDGKLLFDYVGHAAVTDRLLKVDPTWTWEPMCKGPNGEPLIVNGGLWIELTVCGVTRPGWGDGPDIKVMIGDAIRNAAMRFGVALDLWAKEDLQSDNGSAVLPTGEAISTSDPASPAESTSNPKKKINEAQVTRLWSIVSEYQVPKEEVRQIMTEVTGDPEPSTKELTKSDYDLVCARLESWVPPVLTGADGEA